MRANEIICGDNVETMQGFPDGCIDLVVTSPPYDDLRTYGGHSWYFEGVANQLWRVIKPGGVVVWVVADQTIDGSETGTSFRQALRFMEIGFRLHDTMIYERQGKYPQNTKHRYWQNFEFMFVFSKAAPMRGDLLKDRPNIHKKMGGGSERCKSGEMKNAGSGSLGKLDANGYRSNIWRYDVGGGHIGDMAHAHPAAFPERLARDHILSWSNEGDLVLDPFNGSGTTTKMAREMGRQYLGIEINPDYCEIARKRLDQKLLNFEEAM